MFKSNTFIHNEKSYTYTYFYLMFKSNTFIHNEKKEYSKLIHLLGTM